MANYEISIWEDYLVNPSSQNEYKLTADNKVYKNKPYYTKSDNQYILVDDPDPDELDSYYEHILPYYDEYRLGVIGSDDSTSPFKAEHPVLTENTNGTHTLTFSMYKYQFVNTEREENPWIQYLTIERKIKLNYKNKWYDFVINAIKEDKKYHQFSYTCKDLYIHELSKTGYNIEFDTELENGSGTASELVQETISTSSWLFDENSDLIQQKIEEGVYEITLDAALAGCVNEQTKALIDIPSGATILLFYSSAINKEPFIQFMYRSDGDYVTEEGTIKIINSNTYDCERGAWAETDEDYIYQIDGADIFTLYADQILSISYRGERLVRQQRLVYHPLLKKWVYQYEVLEDIPDTEIVKGNTVLGYSEYNYDEANIGQNMLVNSENFSSYSGWHYGTYNSSADMELVYLPNSNGIPTADSKIYLKLNPKQSGRTVNPWAYNEGFYSQNDVMKEGFQRGEYYIFRYIEKDGTFPQGSTKTFSINFYTKSGSADSYFTEIAKDVYVSSTLEYNVFNYHFGDNLSSKWHTILFKCRKSISQEDIVNNKFYLNIYNTTTASTTTDYALYFEKIQFFKLTKQSININYLITRTGTTTTYYADAAYAQAATRYLLNNALKDAVADISWSNIGQKYQEFTFTYDGTSWTTTTELDADLFLNSGENSYILLDLTDLISLQSGDTLTLQCNFGTAYNNDGSISYWSHSFDLPAYVPPNDTASMQVVSKKYKYYDYSLIDDVDDESDMSYIYNGDTEWEDKDIYLTPSYNNNFESIGTLSIKQSNIFNILQTIAEQFKCWIKFDINHDDNGKIIINEYGQQEKYVSIKQDIGENTGVIFTYGIDLTGIVRETKTDTFSTKIIVASSTNENAEDGYCTIMKAKENYAKTNFIFNFDYYINAGLLDRSIINAELYGSSGYMAQLRNLNMEYDEIEELYESAEAVLQRIEAQQKVYSEWLDSYQETIAEQEEYLKNATDSDDMDDVRDYLAAHTDSTTLLSKYKAYIEMGNTKKQYKSDNNNLKTQLTSQKKTVSKYQKQKNKILNKINKLDYEFNHKYERFIKEGTWSSNDYYDSDKYYMDALGVAYTSGQPQITYTINVIGLSQLPEFTAKTFNVGDIAYVEDVEFFGYTLVDNLKTPIRQKVLVSNIVTNLEQHSKDQVTVQNYKTSFETLFSRISTAAQQLKLNEGQYNVAATSVNSDGSITQSSLSSSLARSQNAATNMQNGNIISDNTGILITDPLNSGKKLKITSGGILATTSGSTLKSILSPDKVGNEDSSIYGTLVGSIEQANWNSDSAQLGKIILVDPPQHESSSTWKIQAVYDSSNSANAIGFKYGNAQKSYIDKNGVYHGNITGNVTGTLYGLISQTDWDSVNKISTIRFLNNPNSSDSNVWQIYSDLSDSKNILNFSYGGAGQAYIDYNGTYHGNIIGNLTQTSYNNSYIQVADLRFLPGTTGGVIWDVYQGSNASSPSLYFRCNSVTAIQIDADGTIHGTISGTVENAAKLQTRTSGTYWTVSQPSSQTYLKFAYGSSNYWTIDTSGNYSGNAATATSAASLSTGNWSIELDGTALVFKNSSTTRASLSASGWLTSNFEGAIWYDGSSSTTLTGVAGSNTDSGLYRTYPSSASTEFYPMVTGRFDKTSNAQKEWSIGFIKADTNLYFKYGDASSSTATYWTIDSSGNYSGKAAGLQTTTWDVYESASHNIIFSNGSSQLVLYNSTGILKGTFQGSLNGNATSATTATTAGVTATVIFNNTNIASNKYPAIESTSTSAYSYYNIIATYKYSDATNYISSAVTVPTAAIPTYASGTAMGTLKLALYCGSKLITLELYKGSSGIYCWNTSDSTVKVYLTGIK